MLFVGILSLLAGIIGILGTGKWWYIIFVIIGVGFMVVYIVRNRKK
jgi:hypothetical protein